MPPNVRGGNEEWRKVVQLNVDGAEMFLLHKALWQELNRGHQVAHDLTMVVEWYSQMVTRVVRHLHTTGHLTTRARELIQPPEEIADLLVRRGADVSWWPGARTDQTDTGVSQ